MNPWRNDSNLSLHLWNRRSTWIKGFKSHMDRIRISIPKSLLEEKDSNLQEKGSESLKGRSEDFGEKAKGYESLTNGFKSPRRFLKQIVEKRKRIRISTRRIWIHHLGKWRTKIKIRIHLLENSYCSILRHRDSNPWVSYSNPQAWKCVKTTSFTRFETFSLKTTSFFLQWPYLIEMV